MISLKTEEEIEILKECGRRHARILRCLSELVSEGVSTDFLNKEAERLLEEEEAKASFLGYTPHGARRPYPASLCVSINDEIVHGIPNEVPRLLKAGDIVTLDLGLIYKGLFTDMAVTLPVGSVSDEDLRLIAATEESLSAGISMAKEGNTIGDIGYAIGQVAKKYNLELAEDLAGHGVGYAVHEDPYVPNTGKPGEGLKLVSGMVLAIEPMLVLGKGKIVLDKDGYTYRTRDGKRSAHAEKTVAVGASGPIILTI